MHLVSKSRIHLRENETVSIQPIRVFGIERHALVKENMSSWGQSHGRAGMTGIGFKGGIDL